MAAIERHDLVEGDGDCYVVALEFLVALPEDQRDEYRLCHGVAVGQAEIEGVRHGHAWIERTQELHHESWPFPVTIVTAIDQSNGNNVALPAELYYRLGQIDADTVVRYDQRAAARAAVRAGHYGPWEEES